MLLMVQIMDKKCLLKKLLPKLSKQILMPLLISSKNSYLYWRRRVELL